MRGRRGEDSWVPAAGRLPDGTVELTYFVQGWVAGTGRFSQTHTFAIVLTEVLSAAWMTWLLVAAWRTQDSVPARLANEGVGRPAAI